MGWFLGVRNATPHPYFWIQGAAPVPRWLPNPWGLMSWHDIASSCWWFVQKSTLHLLRLGVHLLRLVVEITIIYSWLYIPSQVVSSRRISGCHQQCLLVPCYSKPLSEVISKSVTEIVKNAHQRSRANRPPPNVHVTNIGCCGVWNLYWVSTQK